MDKRAICVFPEVPEGRHNVARRGSGGKWSEDNQKTPTGVTHGTLKHMELAPMIDGELCERQTIKTSLRPALGHDIKIAFSSGLFSPEENASFRKTFQSAGRLISNPLPRESATLNRKTLRYRFLPPLFLPCFFAARSSITACAAANRAIGTMNGEALT